MVTLGGDMGVCTGFVQISELKTKEGIRREKEFMHPSCLVYQINMLILCDQ
jgi:hypothetical protein